MHTFRHALRCGLVACAAMVAPALTAPGSAATGTVHVEIAKAGFIVGVGGGRGTLVFQGRRYPLRVGGLSFGATIGASKADLTGRAYNLRRASDAGLQSTSGLRHRRHLHGRCHPPTEREGVVLDLRGCTVGLEFNANVSGVEIGLR
jgi:hypothetical protein